MSDKFLLLLDDIYIEFSTPVQCRGPLDRTVPDADRRDGLRATNHQQLLRATQKKGPRGERAKQKCGKKGRGTEKAKEGGTSRAKSTRTLWPFPLAPCRVCSRFLGALVFGSYSSGIMDRWMDEQMCDLPCLAGVSSHTMDRAELRVTVDMYRCREATIWPGVQFSGCHRQQADSRRAWLSDSVSGPGSGDHRAGRPPTRECAEFQARPRAGQN